MRVRRTRRIRVRAHENISTKNSCLWNPSDAVHTCVPLAELMQRTRHLLFASSQSAVRHAHHCNRRFQQDGQIGACNRRLKILTVGCSKQSVR
jgi:hypothetical protein